MDRLTEEALCDLQAQVVVLRMARAALPLYARGSECVDERCGVFAEDWTAELVEQAIACKAK
jgi:hypothetical protein